MQITYGQAINAALKEEMRRDDKIVVFGEDVAQFGGIFGLTRDLHEEFGSMRVKNSPIAENAIAGVGIGAAITGLRPCIELMYSDFMLVAFNELFHCAAKWRFLHGPGYKVPLVVRTAGGAAHGAGAEHSNCFEGLFMHSPGIAIVCPTTPYDAKGLLKTAIRSDNPVLFFEHKQLYQTKGEVPEEEYLIPFGKARIVREGSDVTIVAVGLMVSKVMEAAQQLEKDGISAEVIDPRTLAPFDKDTVFNSIRKTHRAVVVEESNKTGGIGAEIASMIQEEIYDELDGPVRRVAALDVPIPYNVALEAYTLPDAEKIVSAVRSLY